MKRFAPILIAFAALGLSACSAPIATTRDAPMELATVIEQRAQNWTVVGLNVLVPETLTVSEANSIKPHADIVWREDPIGDRHLQVQAIIDEALEYAFRPMDGATPVIVEIEVTRFHALTERARYTFGGEHEVEWNLTVRNAETGEALTGPRHVDITFRALGGQAALESEQRGIGQRERIQSQIIGWAREEFGIIPQVANLAY